MLASAVKNPKVLELDKLAIAAGSDYVDTQIEVSAVAQPDGYSYYRPTCPTPFSPPPRQPASNGGGKADGRPF
ncbi:MAG TPA: hypothetical protein VF742_03050 [Terracidiphilus sp.]